MAGNKFNVDIPDQTIQDVIALLDQVNNLLNPFYQNITDKEKRHLPKIADELFPFARKIDKYLDSNPEYNPPYIDVAETHKDFDNYKKVHPVIEKLQGLEQEVANIGIVASSDAYIQFLAYYNSVKRAAELGIPGADTIYEELSKQFASRGSTPPAP